MSLLTTTRSFLTNRLESASATDLLVGVSGGPDSMVLLDVLRELRSEFRYILHPLHVNYRFHDRADEAFELLSEYCRRHDLTPIGTCLLNPDRHRQVSGGLEARARTLRFDFFERHSEALGAEAVFLAHHRDDQVETILLNLGRGCGPGALSGMSVEMNRGDLSVYRPFLSFPKRGLLEYAEQRDLDYLEDPTNDDETYARNRLRHTVLPEWEQVQPAPVEAIANLSERVKRENDFWDQHLEEVIEDWCWPEETQVDREQFRRQHPAVQFRYLRQMVQSLTGSLQGWNEDNLNDVRELFATGRSGARLSLPGDVQALNEYERGCLLTSSLMREGHLDIPVDVPFERNWLNVGSLRGSTSGEVGVEQSAYTSTLGREQLSDLVVRTWSEGDILRKPDDDIGLKEVFEEHRIPFRARRYWPILCANGEVVGLPGLVDSPDNGGAITVEFRPDHPAFAQLGNGYAF